MTGTHPKNQARLRRRLRTNRRRTRAAQRRGILMLVVLSMLVLFMLMGTTFLITSSQYKDASKEIEKAGRTTFQPEDVLERALMQLLRDTNNRHSAARYHSLLRDMYGADGFVGRVYPVTGKNPVFSSSGFNVDLMPHYAGAKVGVVDDLGPTNGQLMDLYVREVIRDKTVAAHVMHEDNVVGIEIGENGLPIDHDLSQTDGYYNGSLLTMLGGPCRGSSVRVIQYDHISTNPTSTGPGGGGADVTIARFRVMTPQRQDGQPLRFGIHPAKAGDASFTTLTDFIASAEKGHPFVVNGRPYNGTGVGFNAFASPNAARLTALEKVSDLALPVYTPLALTPNATTYNSGNLVFESAVGVYDPLVDGNGNPLYTVYPGPGGADESYDAADFQNMFLALQSPQPRVRGRVVNASGDSIDPDLHYTSGSAAVPQRLDLEDVTIPSFHRPALVNYWLHQLYKRLTDSGESPEDAALAILLPYGPDMKRATGDESISSDIGDLVVDIKRKAMMRPLREDHPHFDGSNALSRYDESSTNVHASDPTDPTRAGALVDDRGTTSTDDDEITFPSWEIVGPWDVDNDRDGAPDSVWIDMGLPVQTTEDGRRYKPLVAMLVEDLDGRLNLNAHGSTEHLANDGDFVPDGGPENDDLDLSSIGANLAQDYDNNPLPSSSDQLPHGSGWGPADITLRPILSPDLPLYDFVNGASLTAKAQYDDYARLLVGRPDPRDENRAVSDPVKTSITFGRYGSFPGSDAVGTQFYSPGRTFNSTLPLNAVDMANTREERVPYDFSGYPLFASEPLSRSAFGQRPDLFSRYGTGLGPMGTVVLESVADGYVDKAFNAERPMLDDSPYELNLSANARRGAVASLDAVKNSYNGTDPIVDDAPFSPAELERILRAFDFDVNKLPDRLWNLVDAFDPQKLAVQDAIIYGGDDPVQPLGIDDPDDMRDGAGFWNPNSLERVAAQAKAAINRRQVTTESWDLPVPNENWTARLLLGADGLPGVAFDDPTTGGGNNEADDDNDGFPNEGDEVGLGVFDPTNGVDFSDSDDYQSVMRYLGKPSNKQLPRPSARLVDYMEYRITLELLRQKVIDNSTFEDRIARLVSEILSGSNNRDVAFVRTRDTALPSEDEASIDVRSLPALMSYGGLLAPEVLAGLKMDLNRPFGDGRDNNGNGVVDEPQEAGEPFVDLDGDGIWEAGEPYHDLDNDGRFYADADGNGVLNNSDWFDFDGDGIFEPIVDSLWGQTPGGPFPFDYTRGADANGRGAYIDSDNDAFYDYDSTAKTGEPRIHDDGQMARQLYARHLYCLMLAVTDENYLAPYDENDPQVLHYIDSRSGFVDVTDRPLAGSSTAYRIVFELHANEFAAEITADTVTIDPNKSLEGLPGGTALENRRLLVHAEANRLARKKLTRRQVAQWAINTVDMRDPDAIQTPFEYDENPWDGWNVVDTNNTPNDLSDDNIYPLDGDLTTNENDFMVRRVTTGGILLPERLYSNGSTVGSTDRIFVFDQSRNVVWGAERPELLMTEGLALHDRRLSDESLDNVEGPDAPGTTAPHDGGSTDDTDDDLDQRTSPQGSAFVELYNPWSADDQMPREFYSRQETYRVNAPVASGAPSGTATYVPYSPGPIGNANGVALDRLSNGIAVRTDPARAYHNDRRMEVNRDGFRIPPHTQDATGLTGTIPNTSGGNNFTLLAASPVWRIICVEEHPDVRNAQPNDNPRDPTGNRPANFEEDIAWVYSTRHESGGGGGLPGSGTYGKERLPAAYRAIAEEQFTSTGSTLVSGAGEPVFPAVAKPFLQPDPDWPAFDRFARPFGAVRRVDGYLIPFDTPTVVAKVSRYVNDQNTPTDIDRVQLIKPDRYIERAFYFIGPPEIPNDSDPLPIGVRRKVYRNLTQPGLLIPSLSIDVRGLNSVYNSVWTQTMMDIDRDWPTSISQPKTRRNVFGTTFGIEAWSETKDRITDAPTNLTAVFSMTGNRFVVTDRFDADNATSEINGEVSPEEESLPLAPIEPGRYAVIGSAGALYEFNSAGIDPTDATDLKTLANRYTSILSRKIPATNSAYSSMEPENKWEQLRRIELIPSPNSDQHQVIIRYNGSDRGPRSSEVFDDGVSPFPLNLSNFTDPLSVTGTLSATPLIQPVVAIPIAGFNISEPLDGYLIRRAELAESNRTMTNLPKLRIGPTTTNPEGEALSISGGNITLGYDQPFDVLRELLADQTSANYRTLHLQRLANPLLAWNPEPLRPNGDPVAEHDPSRPVNPYRTIDSLPMDVYAYNGAEEPASSDELAAANKRPMASKERGLDASLSETAKAINPTTPNDASQEVTPRDLWRAFSRTANTDTQLKLLGGGIPDPIPDPHPDVATYDDLPNASLYAVELQHSLGFANRGSGDLIVDDDLLGGAAVRNVDLNGDGASGELVGAPSVNANNGANETSDDNAYAALHWPNRPFVSEMELLQVPAWGSSRMLTYYSTFNAELKFQPNPYDGNIPIVPNFTEFTSVFPGNDLDEDGDVDARDWVIAIQRINNARWRNQQAPFGHLLNFFQTASAPSRVYPWKHPALDPGNPDDPEGYDPVVGVSAYGAPHFYRILDYVHVPSRFIATDTLLNPQVFGQTPPLGDDPRQGITAPFNRVDNYREPGKVNLNTVVGRRDADETPSSESTIDGPADLWSAVYDGLMHRRQDSSALDYAGGRLLQLGHLGPAWRDIVVSRRGYMQPTYVGGPTYVDKPTSGINYSPNLLHRDFPTFFANPLRSPGGGFNVPLDELQQGGVDASFLRAHYLSPGPDGAWGERGLDDQVVDKGGASGQDGDANRDDASEAGLILDDAFDNNGDGLKDYDIPLVRTKTVGTVTTVVGTIPDSLDLTGVLPDTAAPTPLFAGASTEPSLNTERNPQLRYGPMTRLANLTTTRSGVFAVWITVGFFEVTPVNKVDHPQIWNRYYDNSDQFLPGMEEQFYRVYQNGETLGGEIDIDTGENHRHRGFYIIDRTLPVAFKPGDDTNVDKAILLRRRIE